MPHTADVGGLAGTYGCLCALSGHLAPRISTFHSDYTSAIIPVGAIKICGLILSGCWAEWVFNTHLINIYCIDLHNMMFTTEEHHRLNSLIFFFFPHLKPTVLNSEPTFTAFLFFFVLLFEFLLVCSCNFSWILKLYHRLSKWVFNGKTIK